MSNSCNNIIQKQQACKQETTMLVVDMTVPTRENMFRRIRFNSEHNCLLIDFSTMKIRSPTHIHTIRECIEELLISHSAIGIHCLVNYDDFCIESDCLVELYGVEVCKYLSEKYYKSIQRYTTKTLHSSIGKLEVVLKQKQIKLDRIIPCVEVIGDRYVVEECIGEGSFGKVKLAYDRKTGEKVAIKELDLQRVKNLGIEDFVDREQKIMKQLSSAQDAHDNIVKMYDYFEQDDVVHIVLEYCANGPLEKEFDEHEQFPEQQAHHYFVQIISALEYMHNKHHVMHRDLQLTNICTTDRDVVKIVDFGLADYFSPTEQKHTLFAGNVNYVPPEMTLMKKYVGSEVDVWSAGVCLYKMLVGYFPFRKVGDILIGKFSIPLEEEEEISEECKDLIRNILNPDPEKRYNIRKIKEHPWFNKQFNQN
jgi:serine/threonine-protein kinase RIO1